jgi:hypothetical protein
MDVTMVKNTKKLAHWGIAENRLPSFPFYGQRLCRSSIIVGAIHESPLPSSFNLKGAAQAMILVIPSPFLGSLHLFIIDEKGDFL